MSRFSKKTIRGGLVFLLGVFLAAAIWWLTGPVRHEAPVTAFMPDEISVIVNIRDIRSAWQRHWLHRQGPDPDAAFKEMLVALDEWDNWVKRYGETGARLRIDAYQEAFFQVLGDDAWLIFGSWKGPDDLPGEGEVGLVALIHGDTPVKSRIGPLADLLFNNYQIETGELEGQKIYAYQDEKLSRTLTFCQLKGWICISMRQPGAGPLPEIIRHVRAATHQDRPAKTPPELEKAWGKYDKGKALCALFRPQVFWSQLMRFNDQRGRRFSEKNETKLGYWQQRLDGVDSIALTQNGSSLLDMDVRIDGPRPLQLSRAFAQAGGAVPVATAGEDVTSWKRATGLSQMARIDLDLVFARSLLPLAGHDWDTLLEGQTGLDGWVPGLRALLQGEMSSQGGEALPARIGLAAYASVNPVVPALRFWLDRAPCMPPGQWPAEGGSLDGSAASPAEDLCLWIQPLGNTPTTSTQSLMENEWLLFEDTSRASQPAQSASYGFVSMNFNAITGDLDRVPYQVLGKKVRKKVGQWHAISRGLGLALGGAVLNLETQPEGWRLELRTL